MTRILYIYSRLNPRVQYVQGMNEILAPIFYLVNINKSAACVDEASCFFMFNNAISDIIDLHIKDLDKSENGIYGRLNSVN
jgi:TBC1 domain family member 13